jgi:hypothetical protein
MEPSPNHQIVVETISQIQISKPCLDMVEMEMEMEKNKHPSHIQKKEMHALNIHLFILMCTHNNNSYYDHHNIENKGK